MQNNQTLECSRFKNEPNSHDMVNLYAIYRNPATSVIAFCQELATVLKKNIFVDRGALLLMTDFNMLTDKPSHADTNTFIDFLDSFNLQNHVNFPTHIAQHTWPVHRWQGQLKNWLSYQGSSIIWSLLHPLQPQHRQTDEAWNRNNLQKTETCRSHVFWQRYWGVPQSSGDGWSPFHWHSSYGVQSNPHHAVGQACTSKEKTHQTYKVTTQVHRQEIKSELEDWMKDCWKWCIWIHIQCLLPTKVLHKLYHQISSKEPLQVPHCGEQRKLKGIISDLQQIAFI